MSRRKPVNQSHDGFGVCPSYHIEHTSLSVGTTNIVRDYGDEDAMITLMHENGAEINILLHPDRAATAFLKVNGQYPRNIPQIVAAFPLKLVVIPTLGPLEENEPHFLDETVRRNETTRLAHRNFRNIWYRKTDEEFSEFKKLIEDSWPSMTVKKPAIGYRPESFVEMYFSEERRDREVYWSGFGFQIWMQMMTHIMRGKQDSVIVLDEPDIYLHPDLQRRLVGVLKERFGQIFLSTHSSEIINEVNSSEILTISKKYQTARRVTTDKHLREVFKYIGSSENIEISRISKARRIVFFEGQDKKIFRRFAQKVSTRTFLDDPDTVFLQAGGFSQWRRVKEVEWTLDNVFDLQVKIVSVFDRDYRCDEEVGEFVDSMNSEGSKCFVLGCKEIENFVINVDAVFRLLQRRTEEGELDIDRTTLAEIVDRIVLDMRSDTASHIMSNYTNFYRKKEPNLDFSTLTKRALDRAEALWAVPERRLQLVPGKEFMSVLSTHLQSYHKKSITLAGVLNEMRTSEIPLEMSKLVNDIDSFFSR